MALSDVANITITATSSGLAQQGFGVTLIAAYDVPFDDVLVHTYTEPDQYIAEGGSEEDPAYKKLNAIFSQNPRPDKAKIGRLTAPYTQVQWLTPTAVAEDDVFSFTLYADGQESIISVTADNDDNIAAIVAKLVTEVTGDITGLTPTNGSTHLILTSTAGKIVYIKDWSANLRLEDVTPNPATSIATQLSNIALEDDDWYGLVTDINAEAISLIAASWAESRIKLYSAQTSDWQATVLADHTDLGWQLMNSSTGRTIVSYRKKDTGEAVDAAVLGRLLVMSPGSYTAMGKNLAGISVDALTPTEINSLRAKNYLTYQTTAGASFTLDGKVAGGEYFDVVVFIDWLRIRMQEDLTILITSVPKIPYTEVGITMVESVIRKRLQLGVDIGGLDGKREIVVTTPKIENVPAGDKNARTLNGVKFSAYLQGAIHLVQVTGTLFV